MTDSNETNQSPTDFPNDPTGDALRSIADSGSDLSQPMEIEFHIHVTDQLSGNNVSKAIEEAGMETDLWCDEETEEWTCTCYKTMHATYEGIIGTEEMLAELCDPLGGTPDGWGTFGNAEDLADIDPNQVEERLFGYDEADDEAEG